MAKVLEVQELKKYYPINTGLFNKKWLRAVDGVSFSIASNETFGLVGESGSGKSTLAKCIIRLEDVTSGKILFQNQNITSLSYNDMLPLRRHIQMVFQDPSSSINPRMKVGKTVAEPLWLSGICKSKPAQIKAKELLVRVGLECEHYNRYGHQLSGGQQQRVGIARGIASGPSLIVLDEPTSSLDVSVQAKLINLLKDFQQELKIAFLFISHDLSVVSALSTRVAVMYLGKIVEVGPTEAVFSKPMHPYTQALISAVPVSHPKQKKDRIVLKGEIPSAIDLHEGCRLLGRCPRSMPECTEDEPNLSEVSSGHDVACFHYKQ